MANFTNGMLPLEPRELVEWSRSKALKSAFYKIPEDYFHFSPEEIEFKVNPTQVDFLIKSAFWNEVRVCMADSIPFSTKRICKGICSYQHLFHGIFNNPIKLTWLLLPLQETQAALSAYSILILNRLREILTADWKNTDGSINHSLVKTWLHILRTIHTLPQNTSSHLGQIHSSTSDRSLNALSMEELNEKLRDLRTSADRTHGNIPRSLE
jgi:hypothetical protein